MGYKKVIIIAVCIVCGILALSSNHALTDILAGVFFGVAITVLVRRVYRRRDMAPSEQEDGVQTNASDRPAGNLLHYKQELYKTDNTVAVQATPLGYEFRKKMWIQTEDDVDNILDLYIELVNAKLSCCTIAVFFPTHDGAYALRRFASKNEHVDREARIIPKRGLLGSAITKEKELAPFYEGGFTNKNETLYYYEENCEYKPEEQIRSVMIHPIEADGESKGVFLADSTTPDAFSKEDQEFFATVAKLLGETVYYTYRSTKHSLDYKRLAAMSSIEKDFWKDLTFDTVMDKMCAIIPFTITCDRLTISLKDENKMSAVVVRAQGEFIDGFEKLKFSLDDTISRSIAALAYSNDFGFFRNYSEDKYEYRYCEDEPKHDEFNSFMVVPFGVDKRKGLMFIESFKHDAFSKFNVDLLSRMGTSAGLALEKIFILQKAESLATCDALTGLYNRRKFIEILTVKTSAYARYKKPVSLALCDIDHFKRLNDTYGHPFGDEVLKGVAAKLEECIRSDMDAVARYGGEEFVIIFDQTDTETAAESLERIRQAIEDMTFKTSDGETVKTHMSFGVATYPDDSREMNDLISKADDALYRAKENGRNRVEIY